MTVSPGLTVRELVDDYVCKFRHGLFPVVFGTRVIGCVTIRQVDAVRHDKWSQTPVSVITRIPDKTNSVDASVSVSDVLALMHETGNTRLMVFDGKEFVGVVALSDLKHRLNPESASNDAR